MYYLFLLSSCVSSSSRTLSSADNLQQVLKDYKEEAFYKLYYDEGEFHEFFHLFTDKLENKEKIGFYTSTPTQWSENHFDLFLSPLTKVNFSYLAQIDLYYFFIINLEKHLPLFKDKIMKTKDSKNDFLRLLEDCNSYYKNNYDENELNIFDKIADSSYVKINKKNFFHSHSQTSQQDSINFLIQVYRSLSYKTILSLIKAYKAKDVALEKSFAPVLKKRYGVSF